MFMTNLSASQYRRLANKVSNQRRLVPGYETQLMRRLAPRTRGTQLTPHPGPYFPIGKPEGLSPSVLQLRTILRTTFPQLYEIHQCRVLAYLYTLWSPPRSNTQRCLSVSSLNKFCQLPLYNDAEVMVLRSMDGACQCTYSAFMGPNICYHPFKLHTGGHTEALTRGGVRLCHEIPGGQGFVKAQPVSLNLSSAHFPHDP